MQVSISYNQARGPELHLRLARKLPRVSDIFLAVTSGSLYQVRKQLVEGHASVHDFNDSDGVGILTVGVLELFESSN